MTYIYPLDKITNSAYCGGKANSLSVLINNGLPVPAGYVISSEAFDNLGNIISEAKNELSELIKILPDKFSYAIRSSAIGEDGKLNSFAGVYETKLNVSVDSIADAVLNVAASSNEERVFVYAENRTTTSGKVAVIIQQMIAPDFSGVIFTSDVITGSAAKMIGNYVHGLGEVLVSGESDAESFTINTLKYGYLGNAEFSQYAKKLYKYAVKMCRLFDMPQDIEWAVSNGKVYILQSRPITTLCGRDIENYCINDSLSGEYLLSKTNVGEVFMRPISPMTHSVLNSICEMIGVPLIVNVCGQAYCNISAVCSIIVSFGVSREKAYSLISDIAGNIPENIEIPIYPFDKGAWIKNIIKLIFSKKKTADFGELDTDFANNISEIADMLIEKIHKINNTRELYLFWHNTCSVYMDKVLKSIVRGLSIKTLFKTREKLIKLAGERLTNELCSNCSEDGIIESLQPLLAIDDIISGKITKAQYVKKYGHRHADEMELSCAYPYENLNFPDNIINDYINSGIDAYKMKSEQEKRYNEAVAEFKSLYPSKSKKLDKMLKKFTMAVYSRENIRSQGVRLFCLMREYLLRSAELTGLDDDIFMLYFSEVLDVLNGDVKSLEMIPCRHENYNKYLNMPAFPNVIYGRFEAEKWITDTNHRNDLYMFGELNIKNENAQIKGFAGSSGKIEGTVRVIKDLSDANSIINGEILVTTATNIGWIKIFPKLSAIITDIGAPLSHAVIVARELGIPAVVGCGNATSLLKNGDRVIIDGTNGTVALIKTNDII